MKLRVQVVIESDDENVHEVAQIDRDALSVDTLGLHLAEAKALLQNVQAVLIYEQVRTSLAQQVACPRPKGLRSQLGRLPQQAGPGVVRPA